MASGRVSPKRGKVLDIPTVPTIGTATAGGESATVTFTASTKGGPVSTYTALSNPGSITGTGTTSPVTVSGLTEGTSYTFTIRGNNITGSSEYSSASNSITALSAGAGYVMGGMDPNATSTIEKVTFSSTPVRSVISSTLPGVSRSNTGITCKGTSGYVQRANDPATTTIYKMLFSTEATSTLSDSLGTAVRNAAGINNESTAGYVVNGYGNSTHRNLYQKIAFSNDAVSTISATTGSAGFLRIGVSNGSTAGYTTMGRDDSYPPYYNVIDKLTFSSETRSALSATASFPAEGEGGVSYSGTAGYWFGGQTNANGKLNKIQKLNFSTEACTTLSATLTVNSFGHSTASLNKSGGFGLIMGGYATDFINTIQKFNFSDETNANVSATLASNKAFGAGVSYVA